MVRNQRMLTYPDIRSRLVFALACLLAPWPVVRGLDYLTAYDPSNPVLIVFNASWPVEAWGAVFAAAGTVLIAGLVSKLRAIAWLGHTVCAAAYTGLTISLVQGVAATGVGWRTVGPVFVLCVLHWFLAVIIGPVSPPKPWSVDDASH